MGCSRSRSKSRCRAVQGGPSSPEIGWRESPERAERAPISLTASDGSGLRLVALDARTVIEEPLAFTELHLKFHNPEPRRREGRFEITLPQRAADLALRDARRRRPAGGRGRRAAPRAAGLRGLPAPQAGPGAAREGRGQRVRRARLPDRAERDQGADHLVLRGARSGAASPTCILLKGLPALDADRHRGAARLEQRDRSGVDRARTRSRTASCACTSPGLRARCRRRGAAAVAQAARAAQR